MAKKHDERDGDGKFSKATPGGGPPTEDFGGTGIVGGGPGKDYADVPDDYAQVEDQDRAKARSR